MEELRKEESDLLKKITLIHALMKADEFEDLNHDERAVISAQCDAMIDYADCLASRIALN